MADSDAIGGGGAEQTFNVVINVRTQSDGKAKEILDQTKTSALELNAILEVTQKAFQALRTVIELPIKQFQLLRGTVEELIQEYDEAYTTGIQLQLALRSIGQNTNENREALEAFVQVQAQKTRLDDESIRSGVAQATALKHQGEELKKVVEIAEDYVARYGGDVEGAVLKVDRAMKTGSIRLGLNSVLLTGLTESSAKAADALNELQKLIGGSAAAVAGGGAAPIIQFNKAIGEFRETLGDILSKSPQIEAFYEVLTEQIIRITSYIEVHREQFSDLFGKAFRLSLELAAKAVALFVQIIIKAFDTIFTLYAKLATSSVAGALGFPQETGPEAKRFLEATQRVTDLKIALDELTQEHGKNPFGEDGAFGDSVAIQIVSEKLKIAERDAKQARDALLGIADAKESMAGLAAEIGKLFDELRDGTGVIKSLDDLDAKVNAAVARRLAAHRSGETKGLGVGTGGGLSDSATQTLKEITDQQSIYEQHMRDIDELEQKLKFDQTDRFNNEKRAHEARIKYTIDDLAALTDWQSGLQVAFARTAQEAENHAKVVSDIWNVGINSIADGLAQLANTGKANFRDLATTAIQEINRIIIRLLVLKTVSAIGGSLGFDFSGTPARAEGGPVVAGQTYLVGERGPELFQPKQDGHITANSKLASTPPRVEIQNFVLTDHKTFDDYLNSPAGTATIRNVIGRERLAFGAR